MADLEVCDLVLEKLWRKVRVNIGQNPKASLGIIDSQSLRCGNNKSLNGIDANIKLKVLDVTWSLLSFALKD